MRVLNTTIFNTNFMKNERSLKITAYNPYTNSSNSGQVSIDLDEPQKIVLPRNSRPFYTNSPLTLDYNPERIGTLIDKKKKAPLKTVILKSNLDNSFGYNFMSEDLTREYGFVSLTALTEDCDAYYDIALVRNYKEQGIVGPRVIVDYLQNWDDKAIGGVGLLADKLAVELCMDNNIDLNIVSFADLNSHAAHYIRGKRFFPLTKDSDAYNFFQNLYGMTNINKILSGLFKNFKKTGQRINLQNWGHLVMYMPKQLAKKYAEEIIKRKVK